MYAIKYSQLKKAFRKNPVLKNIHFEIPEGRIFFLIGRNGAGKSTLLKLTVKLLFPDEGKIDLSQHCQKIGCSIDEVYFHEDLSAFDNLKYYSKVMGKIDENHMNDLLAKVHLDAHSKKRAKSFSLGMKKRLSIAVALLNHPEILILDEPFNGLDPVGINEMKRLFVKLQKEEKMTIILSSHLIKETEDICTDFGILHNGEIIATFSKAQLQQKTNDLTNYFLQLTEGAVHIA